MTGAPAIRGNVLRLLWIGTGTVLGTMLLIVLGSFLVEGTSMRGTIFVYGLLAAGTIIIVAALPSFVVWFLVARLLAWSGLFPQNRPAATGAVTASIWALVITAGIASFDSSIRGLSLLAIGGTLVALGACVAILMTLLLYPSGRGGA